MGYKNEYVENTAVALIKMFFDRAEELRDECQEVVVNAPDGLRSSSRIEALEEASNTLWEVVDGDLYGDEVGLMGEIDGIEAHCVVSLKTGKRRGQESRAIRMANGVSMGTAGVVALRAWSEDERKALDVTGNPDNLSDGALRLAADMREERRKALDELDYWLEVVEGHIGSAEGVEFPGWGG